MNLLTRRSVLRGLFAMPAVVAYGNIMPVRSIERFLEPVIPLRTVYVPPRMFDDLLDYIRHFQNEIVRVTGVSMQTVGYRYSRHPLGNDMLTTIKDGVFGIDWPAENVRIERVELLEMAVSETERHTFPYLRDAGHTHNMSFDPHSHSFGDIMDIHKVRDAHRVFNGEIGEYSGTRLVRGT